MFDIKKQFMWSKLKVGLVISLALLTLFITVFFAGNIQDLFSPKINIKAEIKDVRGLRRGSPVWISGIEIGSVKTIDLHPDHGTVVTLAINKNAIKCIKRDSKATVLTMGLLGDKYIEINGGSPDADSIKSGDVLEGTMQLEIQDIVNASSVSIQKVTEFMDKFTTFIENIEKSEGTLAKFLTDPSIYNNLKDTTGTLSNILRNFKESEGTLKLLMDDPSLYKRMVNTTSSLEEFSRKLNEGRGTLKKLSEDPSLYENLNKASHQLSSILERIDAGEGVAGTLVKDKELNRDLKESLSELKTSMTEFKELIKDVKEHPKKYLKFSVF